MPLAPLAAVAGSAMNAGAVGAAALPTLPALPATTGAPAAGATSFGQALAGAVEGLSATQRSADALATKAATGDLTDAHDYMIAATQASLATEMTVAVRNKAVEAFQSIMQMPI